MDVRRCAGGAVGVKKGELKQNVSVFLGKYVSDSIVDKYAVDAGLLHSLKSGGMKYMSDKISEKDIKILVSYHKPSVLLKNKILTPIHAGRSVAQKPTKDGFSDEKACSWLQNNMIGDDTGDNISGKNRSYNEVTSIYWAWKNREALDNPLYIGFMHYRRQFIFDDSKLSRYENTPWIAPESAYKIHCLSDGDMSELFSEEQIVNAVSEADVLVPKPWEPDITVFEQYARADRAHVLSDLELVLSVIDEKFPEYSESAKEYIYSRSFYLWNMFVMRWDVFDEYCKFLFGISREIEDKIDISDRSILKQRFYAYLAERITGIFITQLKKRGSVSIKEKYSIFEEYTDIPREPYPSFENNSVTVVFSSDNNYAPYLSVALKSLICNSSPETNYDIIILDDHIEEKNKEALFDLIPAGAKNIKIQIVDITPYVKDLDKSIFYIDGHFSISSYYRFFIPRILKNFSRAVYLDCDIVVLSDIAELYNEDLGPFALGAVRDTEVIRSIQPVVPDYQIRYNFYIEKLRMKNPNNYFQSGILLLDLNKLREENFDARCIERLIEVKTPIYVDQDILNSLYENRVKFLPMKWNIEWQLPIQNKDLIEVLPAKIYVDYTEAYSNPSILHYCSIYKPWKSPDLPMAKHFWKYARLTPFYEEILFRMMQPKEGGEAVQAVQVDASLNDAPESTGGNETETPIVNEPEATPERRRNRFLVLIKKILKKVIKLGLAVLRPFWRLARKILNKIRRIVYRIIAD